MDPDIGLLQLYNKYHGTLGLSGVDNAAILVLAHVIQNSGIDLKRSLMELSAIVMELNKMGQVIEEKQVLP